MQFIAPLAFLAGLIAIPIVLLYMLKLRREEIVVSTNFLWQQVIQDREANTPWQRLKRNLLLFLQLLILALLVLALARPAQTVPTLSAGRTALLLDASASMNATDGDADGRTRFEIAQEQAAILAGQLGPDDEMTVIRVAEVTAPLIEYTGSLTDIRQAIQNAEPGRGGGDWNTALTLAAAGAEGADAFNIIAISDGGFGTIDALPENIPAPLYVPVGTSRDNVAITALAARSNPGEAPQLFAQVENYSAADAGVSLVIRLDGDLWESTRQTIAAQSQRSFVFSVDEPFTTIEAHLVIDEGVPDVLPDDNAAYAVTSDAATRRVLLVSEGGNLFIEQALRSLPGIQTFRGSAARNTLPSQPYDLYIFDGWLPETLPQADLLLMNPPTNSDLFAVGDEESGLFRDLQAVAPDHPLLAFVDVGDISLNRYRTLEAGSWADPLVTTADGAPLLLAGTQGGRQIALLAFDIRASDLPLKIAWPVLMANLIEWFTPSNLISGDGRLQVGETVTINPPTGTTSVQVTLPDGETATLPVDDDTLAFTQTTQPGLYTLQTLDGDATTETQIFAVNLFGAGESNIAPLPEGAAVLGGGAADPDAEEQLSLREFWPLLAFVGLLVLLLEWVLYYRRVGNTPDLRRLLRNPRRGLGIDRLDERRKREASYTR